MAGEDAHVVALGRLDEDALRAHPPDDAGDVAAELEAHRQPAVGVGQPVDVVDADLGGGGGLLGATDSSHLGPRDALVEAAGIAIGDDAVRHGDALGGPGRHRTGGAEVDVVGMGGDHEDAIDRLGLGHGGMLARPRGGTRRADQR